MKKAAQHLIAEVPRRQPRVTMTIGIDLGDVWSHHCTLNQDGEVVDRGRFRTTPKAIEKWFIDVPPARVAMEAGTHSIWISEQLQVLNGRAAGSTHIDSCAEPCRSPAYCSGERRAWADEVQRSPHPTALMSFRSSRNPHN
jgi:hypothetical protein